MRARTFRGTTPSNSSNIGNSSLELRLKKFVREPFRSKLLPSAIIENEKIPPRRMFEARTFSFLDLLVFKHANAQIHKKEVKKPKRDPNETQKKPKLNSGAIASRESRVNNHFVKPFNSQLRSKQRTRSAAFDNSTVLEFLEGLK